MKITVATDLSQSDDPAGFSSPISGLLPARVHEQKDRQSNHEPSFPSPEQDECSSDFRSSAQT